jgi:hypothetical protein
MLMFEGSLQLRSAVSSRDFTRGSCHAPDSFCMTMSQKMPGSCLYLVLVRATCIFLPHLQYDEVDSYRP